MTTGQRGAQPLEGRRVLITRSRGQAGELAARVRDLGGEPLLAPMITVEPGDLDALAGALEELAAGAFAVWCLTSPNGVAAVVDALEHAGVEPGRLADAALLACVGPGTARAVRERLGLSAGLVPGVSTTAALAAAIPPGRGRVLLARAEVASEALPRVLRGKGYEVVEVTAYRTAAVDQLPAGAIAALREGSIDSIVVASPSAARALVGLLAGEPWSRRVVSIGPVTSEACGELGLVVTQEAVTHDLDGLLGAIVADGSG